MNRIFCSLLQLMRYHIGVESATWLCRVNYFSVQIIQYVTCDPVKDYMLPIAEKLRHLAEKAYKDEEHMRTHPDDADEGTVAEVWNLHGFLSRMVPNIFYQHFLRIMPDLCEMFMHSFPF